MEIDDIRLLYERIEDFLTVCSQIPDGQEEEGFTPEMRQLSEDLIREGRVAVMAREDEEDTLDERETWGKPSCGDSDEERDAGDTITVEDDESEDFEALADEKHKVEELTRHLDEARSILLDLAMMLREWEEEKAEEGH